MDCDNNWAHGQIQTFTSVQRRTHIKLLGFCNKSLNSCSTCACIQSFIVQFFAIFMWHFVFIRRICVCVLYIDILYMWGLTVHRLSANVVVLFSQHVLLKKSPQFHLARNKKGLTSCEHLYSFFIYFFSQ